MQAEELIDEIRSYLPKIIRATESGAELLFESVTEKGYEVVSQIVDGLYVLQQMIEMLMQTPDFAHEYFPLNSVLEASVESFVKTKTDFISYINTQDFIPAGDIMKYEINTMLQDLNIAFGEDSNTMDKRFVENLSYLKNRFPRVYRRIMKISQSKNVYQVAYAKDGNPNLIYLSNNSDPVYLYSKYSPIHEAERWAEAQVESVHRNKELIMYGLGFGYHINALFNFYSDIEVYLYEPDEDIFILALHLIDFKNIFENEKIKALVVGDDKQGINRIVNKFFHHDSHEIAAVEMKIYTRINKQGKERFLDRIKSAMHGVVTDNSTLRIATPQWTRNCLFNLPKILSTPSFNGMRGAFQGLSVVIVGAGPSLELDIEHLKVLKEHAIIIAAGSTVQTLQHYGLKPHLVVSMDGYEANYLAFKDVDTDSIPFLFYPMIEYRILENRQSDFMHGFFLDDFLTYYLMGLQSSDPIFSSTYSVTGAAIQAAIYMGCKEIIFSGQDMSFSRDKFYATGATHISENAIEAQINEASEWVENVQGSKNRTNMKMKLTLEDLEDVLDDYPQIKFTNTTRMGANIKYTRFELIEDTISRLRCNTVPGDIVQNEMSVRLKKYDKHRISEIMQRLQLLPAQMTEISNSLDEIQKSLNLLPKLKLNNQQQCVKEMGKIEDLWGFIVQNKAFNSIYMRSLSAQIFEFDRNRPKLEKERNVLRKAELFNEILGKLVGEMREQNNSLINQLAEAMDRLNAFIDKTAQD